MKLIPLMIASILMLSLANAENVPKTTGTKVTQKKKTKVKPPVWMLQDKFILSTADNKRVSLLSTKKGFSFKGSEGKITLLVVWTRACKSCAQWLEDLNALQKTYPGKVKIVGLEISNTEKSKLEKLIKEGKADSKAVKKIIDKNNASIRAYAKKHHLDFPIVSPLSNEGNLAFALQTLYKYEFNKPRGKSKRGGALPFTVVFGYQGQTAGITAGVSEKKAYTKYIGDLIKHYEKKK